MGVSLDEPPQAASPSAISGTARNNVRSEMDFIADESARDGREIQGGVA